MPDPESGRPPDTRSDDTAAATTPGGGSSGTGPLALEGRDHLGPYRIVRLLGGGGMGQVYEAIHEESGHRLAIKILPPNALGTERARERFLREGTLAASINHPNSLYVYGTEEIDGLPLIAMELAPGGTLTDRVDADGPLDPSEVIAAALQIADGLEAAAACGILHRDIKPSNCFVDRDGSVKVGDYGLSISTTEEEATQLTATGVFLGTPAYASPEQIRGGTIDVRSDIYSVGATLYFLVSGQHPFAESTGLQLMASILEKEPLSPRRIRDDLPKGLAAVILRCLRKDPAERFVDYAELRRALAPLARVGERAAGRRDRFLAGFVDSLTIAIPVTLLSTFFSGMALSQEAINPRGFWFDAWATLAVALPYGTILEGRWGITVGKALFGLRVAGPDGGPPGIPTAGLRSLIYLAPRTLLAVLAAWLVTIDLRTAASIASACVGFALLIPFVTARKANGYEAIHDSVTRTHVLAARRRTERPKLPAGANKEPLRSGARIGPFEVANVAPKPGTILEGYDPSLRRRVWIRVESLDAPAVSETRRSVSRLGRLRWLNGRRADRDSWDAFEAVGGRPFAEVARVAHPWSAVRFWLRDLANEFRAADEDGTLPFMPDDDAVWITEDGRAMLLEFPPPGAEPEATAGSGNPTADRAELGAEAVQEFLARFARRALKGDAPAAPLPLFARRLIERLELASFASLEDARQEIESVSGRGPAIGRGRRVLHHAIAGLVPMFAVITFLVVKGIFDDLWMNHRDALLLESAVSELRRLSDAESDGGPLTEEQEAQLSSLEIYVAGPVRHSLPDPEVKLGGTSIRRFLFRPEEEEWLREFWEKHEVPGDGELAEATASLQPLLQTGLRPFSGLNPAQIVATFAVLAVAVAGMFVAPLGVLLGTLFRGGAVLRLLGIAVVSDDGAPVGLARALLRSLVAWLPALGVAFLLRGSFRSVIRGGDAPGPLLVLLTLLFLAGVVWTVITPQRGPQDRIARTWLVPR